MPDRQQGEDPDSDDRFLIRCTECGAVYVGETGDAGRQIMGRGEQCPCGNSEFTRT